MTIPATPTTPSEILLDTAALLERTGWHQGCLARNSKGFMVPLRDTAACSYCLMGAFMLSGVGAATEVYLGTLKILKDALGTPEKPAILMWNDEPGRTKEEVLKKVREIAAEAAGTTVPELPVLELPLPVQ